MYNGSLDADVAVYLTQFTEKLESLVFCNEMVDTMAAWLKTIHTWPNHFLFKGRHFEIDRGGLAYVARYYIMLARTEATIKALKTVEVETDLVLSLENFFKAHELLSDEFLELQKCYKQAKSASSIEPNFFVEGNTSIVLMHNYVFSLIQLQSVKEMVKAELGFPSFHTYEHEARAQLAKARAEVKEAIVQVKERLEVLSVRLRYDSIQREIEALEMP